MPWKGNDFQWDRDEAYADLTQDQYGSEYVDAVGRLINLENGVRHHWAQRLRERAQELGVTVDLDTVDFVADLLDPYTDLGSAGEAWGRTVLGPESLQPE